MSEEIKNTENEEIKGTDDELVEIVGVTFREAGKIYYFAPGKIKCATGERVIVSTARGTELGTVKLPNKLI
ncbi:MAG: hypothetical protein IIX96_02640, partial [Clostridia bacterium]|nr:hypothetical protein [Clostridia bacterium]